MEYRVFGRWLMLQTMLLPWSVGRNRSQMLLPAATVESTRNRLSKIVGRAIYLKSVYSTLTDGVVIIGYVG